MNAAFFALCFGITMFFVLRGQDTSAVVDYIISSRQGFWLGAIVLVVAFILCESCIIFYMMTQLGQKVKLTHCFLYSFVGFFFTLVTPTGSGGQPVQLLFMNKDKLPLSISTVVLLIITITYKSVLVIVGLVIVLFRPEGIIEYLDPVMFWIWLGLTLNIVCVAGMLALIFFPEIAKRIVAICLHFLQAITKSKRLASIEKRSVRTMENYAAAADYVWHHGSMICVVMIITIVQRFLLFAVTFLVLRSFNIFDAGFWQTLLLQGSISLSADMLPLPGGTGISEYMFVQVFMPICGAQLTVPALVISRGLSFYAQLLICALMTAVAYLVVFYKKDASAKKAPKKLTVAKPASKDSQ